MKQRTRIYYSEEKKSQMWDRWQKGESLHSIARLFDRHHPSISRILGLTRGILPQKRTCSSLALTLSEREDISRGIATHLTVRAIAAQLRRAPSTGWVNEDTGFNKFVRNKLEHLRIVQMARRVEGIPTWM